MTNTLALTKPLMRQTVEFDRFNDLFEKLLIDTAGSFDTYPPYNIDKLDADEYRVVMAVAGFNTGDFTVVLQERVLTDSGHIRSKDKAGEGFQFLHRGFVKQSFERTFRLDTDIQVTGANMKDGLLTINLEREIPGEKKPRMIPI